MTDAVGYAAMCLTVTAFVPQTIKCWRTKKTHDVSIATWFLTGLGAAFWMWYALCQPSWPLLLTNVVVLSGATSIVLAKVRYG